MEGILAYFRAAGKPKKPSLRWAGLPLLTVFLLVLLELIAPLLVKPQSVATFAPQILSGIYSWCKPEPLEHLQYPLLLLTVFGFYSVLFALRGVFKSPRFDSLSATLETSAQILFAAWIALNLAYQNSEHIFFTPITIVRTILYFAILAEGLRWLTPRLSRLKPSLKKTLYFGSATLLPAGFLLAAFYTEGTLNSARDGVVYHFPYAMDEFAAIWNGRTMLTDFFPQYQRILPYLALPFFKVFGLGVGSFSFMLLALSWVSLIAVFGVFVKTAPSRSSAWIAFVLWLGTCFFPIEAVGRQYYMTYNYPALGPLRYFGLWLIAGATAWALSLPTLRASQRFALFLLAGFVAINNMDFGMPAFLGSLLALTLASARPFQTLALGTLGGLSAISTFTAGTYLRSGELPRLLESLDFQKSMVLYGITSIPAPSLGLHWIVLTTILCALVLGLEFFLTAEQSRKSDSRLRTLNGLLVFSGIAASGAFAYYINRSHWAVLCGMFSLWAFCFFLICFVVWENREGSRLAKALTLIGAHATLYFLLSSATPFSQIPRLQETQPGFAEKKARILHTLAVTTQPGEKVVICFPYGHWYAQLAGLINVFPYAQDGSLVLKSQIDVVTNTIESNHITKVYGEFPRELQSWLEAHDFIRIRAVPDHSDLEIWQRVPYLSKRENTGRSPAKVGLDANSA